MQANPDFVIFSVKDLDDEAIENMSMDELKSMMKLCRESQIHTDLVQQGIAIANPFAIAINPIISSYSLQHYAAPSLLQQQQPPPAVSQESAAETALKTHFEDLVNQSVSIVSQEQDFFLQPADIQKKKVLFQLLPTLYLGVDFADAVEHNLPWYTSKSVGRIKRGLEEKNDHLKLQKEGLEKKLGELSESVEAKRTELEVEWYTKLEGVLRQANAENPQASSGHSQTESLEELLTLLVSKKSENQTNDQLKRKYSDVGGDEKAVASTGNAPVFNDTKKSRTDE